MTINFVAILSHRLDNSNILSAPDMLNGDQEQNAAAAQLNILPFANERRMRWQWRSNADEQFLPTNSPLEWLRAENRQEGFMDLIGPDRCIMDIGRSTCLTGRRWQYFVQEMEYQTPMRHICHAVARIFGSNREIYVPDSNWDTSSALDWFFDGFTFEQIQDCLLKNYGPPVATLKNTDALLPENHIGGYYIDDFKDLD